MTSTLQPSAISFRDAPGWTSVETPIGSLIPQQAGNIEVAWTTNVEVADADIATKWPLETPRRLSFDGVLVYVSAARRLDDPELYRPGFEPIPLSGGFLARNNYEGQPAPNVSHYSDRVKIADWYVELHIFYGRNEPDATLLGLAAQALTRLSIPK